jgi:hypothetical protein
MVVDLTRTHWYLRRHESQSPTMVLGKMCPWEAVLLWTNPGEVLEGKMDLFLPEECPGLLWSPTFPKQRGKPSAKLLSWYKERCSLFPRPPLYSLFSVVFWTVMTWFKLCAKGGNGKQQGRTTGMPSESQSSSQNNGERSICIFKLIRMSHGGYHLPCMLVAFLEVRPGLHLGIGKSDKSWQGHPAEWSPHCRSQCLWKLFQELVFLSLPTWHFGHVCIQCLSHNFHLITFQRAVCCVCLPDGILLVLGYK